MVKIIKTASVNGIVGDTNTAGNTIFGNRTIVRISFPFSVFVEEFKKPLSIFMMSIGRSLRQLKEEYSFYQLFSGKMHAPSSM